MSGECTGCREPISENHRGGLCLKCQREEYNAGRRLKRRNARRRRSIECAAVRWLGRTYALARPATHSDVIRDLIENENTGEGFKVILGFLLNDGRFLTGAETAEYIGHEGMLTSEDLW